MTATKLDWRDDKQSVFKIIGASNHCEETREQNDYYATDPHAVDVLLADAGITFDGTIWECACGEGHLSKRLEEYGYHVTSTDLYDRGYGAANIDFLTQQKTLGDNIITNPPYKYALEFCEKALELVEHGKQVVMFLKLTFLEGKKRKEFFSQHPPKYVIVSSSRIMCAKNGDFDDKPNTQSAVSYAWFIWEKGYSGLPTIMWAN